MRSGALLGGAGHGSLEGQQAEQRLGQRAPGPVRPGVWQLPLGPEGGERGPGQPEASFVDEKARFPAGEELGVEAVETLDLEVRVQEADNTAEQPLPKALRIV